MPIYTRQGDYGQTSNFYGDKISKGSLLIELQGSIDEINSGVGHLRSLIDKEVNNLADDVDLTLFNSLRQDLADIQYAMFRIGSDVTTGFGQVLISKEEIDYLEKRIDVMTSKTGVLQRFIYLSGHPTATYAHVLRSVTRRCERVFVRHVEELLHHQRIQQVPVDYQYVNRLADYLFQTARYLNYVFKIEEEEMTLRQ